MKKLLSVFIMVVLLMGISGVPIVKAAGEEDLNLNKIDTRDILTDQDKEKFEALSDEALNEKEVKLSNTYSEGEVVSKEDTKLILYLMSKEKSSPMLRSGKSSKSVSKTVNKFKTKVVLSGTMHQNIAFLAGGSSFRGNVKLTRKSGKLKKVSLATHHSSYGILGWNGKYPSMGCVYSGKVSMSKKSSLNVTQMDKTKKYNSIGSSYTTMYTQATVTTSKGDQYTVTSPTWKKVQ